MFIIKQVSSCTYYALCYVVVCSAQVFPPGFHDTALLNAYNAAVLRVLDAGTAEVLTKRFIQVPQAACKAGEFSNQSMQVQWNQVSGLWVMMAGALGIGLIIVGFIWVPRWIASNKTLSKWMPCCLRFAKPPKNVRYRQEYKSIRRGAGTEHASKSNLEPRIPTNLHGTESDIEWWAEQYAGSSIGYLDGSADIVPWEVQHRGSAGQLSFERLVVAQLSRLQATIARLEMNSNTRNNNTGNGPHSVGIREMIETSPSMQYMSSRSLDVTHVMGNEV